MMSWSDGVGYAILVHVSCGVMGWGGVGYAIPAHVLMWCDVACGSIMRAIMGSE